MPKNCRGKLKFLTLALYVADVILATNSIQLLESEKKIKDKICYERSMRSKILLRNSNYT